MLFFAAVTSNVNIFSVTGSITTQSTPLLLELLPSVLFSCLLKFEELEAIDDEDDSPFMILT